MSWFLYPILFVSCVTTIEPHEVNIVLLGAPVVTLPYDTYQALRTTLDLPDVVCE